MVLEIVTKKREVITLGENKELNIKINEKLSLLYSMIDNQYSGSIKSEAETLIKHYEYVEEIINALD
jgi:hypothetical protein